MTIRTKLLISVIVSIVLVVVLGFVFIQATLQANEAAEKGQIVNDINDGIFELNLLTFDYTLRPAERAQQQWQIKHDTVTQLLASEQFNRPDELAILDDIGQRHASTKALFLRLAESWGEQAGNDGESPTFGELEERLTGQLSVESQAVFGRASQLAQLNRTEIVNAQRSVNVLSAIFILVLVGIAAGTAYFIYVGVAQPISHLTQVADKISRGSLGVEIERVDSKDEIGQLARSLKLMTDNLIEANATLEQRVANRTRGLELVGTVSERLAGILDFDQLLVELVDQVKESFNYYHAQIYILDEERQDLIMTAGVGEAGVQMKAKGHHILLNTPTSLVARAARTKKVVNVPNVRLTPDWLANPLLPNTYSEMAVPIIVEGQVAGVLDVQQNKTDGFDEGDANLLRSLANQVAVAIRNARLFEQVRSALAEAHTFQERYQTQTWGKTRASQGVNSQYLYVQPTATSPDEVNRQLMAQAQQLAWAQDQPVLLSQNDDDSPGVSLVAPIRVRDRAIGALQLRTSDDNRLWTERELAFVQAVADQIAQTAENLRLFEETRQRAGREAAIREITNKLRAAPNIDSLLETAARELGSRLGVRHTVLEVGIETTPDGSNGADDGHS